MDDDDDDDNNATIDQQTANSNNDISNSNLPSNNTDPREIDGRSSTGALVGQLSDVSMTISPRDRTLFPSNITEGRHELNKSVLLHKKNQSSTKQMSSIVSNNDKHDASIDSQDLDGIARGESQ